MARMKFRIGTAVAFGVGISLGARASIEHLTRRFRPEPSTAADGGPGVAVRRVSAAKVRAVAVLAVERSRTAVGSRIPRRRAGNVVVEFPTGSSHDGAEAWRRVS
jgi:hypothetical protein